MSKYDKIIRSQSREDFCLSLMRGEIRPNEILKFRGVGHKVWNQFLEDAGLVLVARVDNVGKFTTFINKKS